MSKIFSQKKVNWEIIFLKKNCKIDSITINHIPNIPKWLCLPSLHGNPQRVHQIEMVIWEQDDNWSQWLWIVRLGKSVKVWQRTSCVAVSCYKKNSLFPLKRQKEKARQREEAWRMGDSKSTILLSPSCLSWALQAAAAIVDQSTLLLLLL